MCIILGEKCAHRISQYIAQMHREERLVNISNLITALPFRACRVSDLHFAAPARLHVVANLRYRYEDLDQYCALRTLAVGIILASPLACPDILCPNLQRSTGTEEPAQAGSSWLLVHLAAKT